MTALGKMMKTDRRKQRGSQIYNSPTNRQNKKDKQINQQQKKKHAGSHTHKKTNF